MDISYGLGLFLIESPRHLTGRLWIPPLKGNFFEKDIIRNPYTFLLAMKGGPPPVIPMFDPIRKLMKGKIPGISGETRTGLLANHTSFSLELGAYTFQLLARATDLRKIFLPEHGLFAELQDQIPLTDTEPYSSMGITAPITSLYGDQESSLTVSAEALADLDILVVDLQDVGSRYYTFATTLSYIFDVLSRVDLPLEILILDRPNPAGKHVEGTILPESHSSFVGRPGLPHRHGLTLGELAIFYKKTTGARNRLRILSYTDQKESLKEGLTFGEIAPGIELLQGADHELIPGKTVITSPGTGFHYQSPWIIAPSPNMPSPVTPLVYSGQCLLEGTNLSEGRGTTRPFEVFGAPYLKLDRIQEARQFPGAVLRPLKFLPTFHKWSGEVCEGFQIHLNGEPYHSLAHTLLLLREIKREHPETFEWRKGAYEFRSDRPAIELLCGDPVLLDFINGESDTGVLLQYLHENELLWLERAREFQIYRTELSTISPGLKGKITLS